MRLDRTLIRGPHLIFASTEKEFHAELKKIKLPRDQWGQFLIDNAYATTHVVGYDKTDRQPIVAVCMKKWKGATMRDYRAALVHEATHVWQFYLEHIGEKNPGDEIAAYAIEGLATALIDAWTEVT